MPIEPQPQLVLDGLLPTDAFAAVVHEIRMPLNVLRNVMRLLERNKLLPCEHDPLVVERDLGIIDAQLMHVLTLRNEAAGHGHEPSHVAAATASVLTSIGMETAAAAARVNEHITAMLHRCDRDAVGELRPLLDGLPAQSVALVASVQQLLQRDLVHYVNRLG